MGALTTGLPPEAAVWREEREEQGNWTQSHELSALLVETVDAWGRIQWAQSVSPKPLFKTMPPPFRIQHPDRPELEDERQRKPTSDAATIAAFFATKIGKAG